MRATPASYVEEGSTPGRSTASRSPTRRPLITGRRVRSPSLPLTEHVVKLMGKGRHQRITTPIPKSTSHTRHVSLTKKRLRNRSQSITVQKRYILSKRKKYKLHKSRCFWLIKCVLLQSLFTYDMIYPT